jgi:HD-GYP domain-containing protein (c-di-GMP phosphodiesterase class II)
VKEKIEALLRDMQTGVGLRLLYPAEHPRIRQNVEGVVTLLRDAGQDHPEISVFVVGERVIHDGVPLPGGAALARGFFTTLHACGYDCLTLRRSASPEELDDFLAAMAEAVRQGGQATPTLTSSAHIRLSALKGEEAAPAPSASDAHFAHETVVLQEVWTTLRQDRRLDLGALEGIVLTLSKTVDEHLGALLPMAALKSHDEYTATHITNVSVLAMGLAEALGLSASSVRDVGVAALLHDVGKLEVPGEILNKPERLSEEQYATMRRHPEDGARLLLATTGVPELAVAVAYEHHIRYDGGGYPSVPRAWKTTLATSITQVADIYDALRTDRPYRPAHPHAAVEQMMVADSGAIFDPELLDVFFDVVAPADRN